MPITLKKSRASKPAPASEPAPPELPEELLTIREAMAFAKAADPTIRRWIRQKKLRAYKLCGQVRIDKADLLKLLHPWSPKKYCEKDK